MAVTALTIENETTVTSSGTGGNVVIFTPSPAEIGRFRIRVIRWVFQAAPTVGDLCKVEGITQKPDGTGTETQLIWESIVPSTTTFVDQTSFPDECEFRGSIKVTITVAASANVLFLHHG